MRRAGLSVFCFFVAMIRRRRYEVIGFSQAGCVLYARDALNFSYAVTVFKCIAVISITLYLYRCNFYCVLKASIYRPLDNILNAIDVSMNVDHLLLETASRRRRVTLDRPTSHTKPLLIRPARPTHPLFIVRRTHRRDVRVVLRRVVEVARRVPLHVFVQFPDFELRQLGQQAARGVYKLNVRLEVVPRERRRSLFKESSVFVDVPACSMSMSGVY